MHRAMDRLLAAFLLMALALSAARAASPLGEEGVETANVKARLVAETRAVAPGSSFLVALHLDIRDGWHTYWKFPGDSGAATTIAWNLPPGFAASDIIWPLPEQVPLGPLMNFGYEREAYHLVSITVPPDLAPGSHVELKAAAEWLVCSDEVCIPEWGDFALGLPVAPEGQNPRPDPIWGKRIQDEVARLPTPAPFDVAVTTQGEIFNLAIRDASLARALKSGEIAKLVYIPPTDGIVRHAAPQRVDLADEGASLTTETSYLTNSGRTPEPLGGLLIATSSKGERTGYEIAAVEGKPLMALAAVAPAGPASPTGERGGGVGAVTAIVFAFLGGLILNLMPCVFPVLSIKALGFVARAHESPAELRRHGWLFAAGVLASFLVLGGALYLLRGAGAEIGWGYQLQSPIIVLILAYLMFVVGLSLSGVVTIGIGLAGFGDRFTRKAGATGAFFTGVLATLVATPCTAPFMGAAMGFAIAAPAALGIAVFLALGLGLAAPYLVLSHAPGLVRRLPKPGAWMERLKEFLAFPMYATAAWLIWVLAQQSGPSGLLAALVGLVLIGFAAWALSSSGGTRRALLWTARIAALAAILSALGLAGIAGRDGAAVAMIAPDESGASVAEATWQPYSAARLDEARAAGRPVFVNLTAAWCITCKVNELGTLSSRRVHDRFAEGGVLRLKGDWTNRNPEITELLSAYGRAGVPLYLYYPAGAGGAAKILPQILTEDIVLDALGG